MKKWLLLIVIVVTGGCSSKLAYDNLDWLIYWYMDDYVELNDRQEAVFDEKLDAWIDWHRSEELSKYEQQLQQLQQHIRNDELDKETIAYHLDQGKQHIDAIRNKLAPELAKLATRLDDEQIVYLFAALEKENEEEEENIREAQEESADERLEELTEDIEEEFEDRLGDLTDQQEDIIARYAAQFNRSGMHWIAFRRDIQNAARRLFITRDSNENFEQDLTYLMNNPDEYRSDTYLALRDENRQQYLNMASELAPTMTPDQKEHLLDKVDEWLEDIRDLQK
ncbi:DUF6279 family lipoprotein [Salinimonas chungwhensis]|uniref:DUF6279 family lipoprotein n=1 Tax=Salinimonas chungwhensis TaxID=265425 RepID=UPI00036A5FFD|nr:DUF6279 family lipoprotein [Salinimonas chungwhensis]